MSDRPNAAMLRDLEQAGARNSTVYHALVKARSGEMSWCDALAWAVVQFEGCDRGEAAIASRPANVPVAKPVKPENVPIAEPVQSPPPAKPLAKPIRSTTKFRSESVFESDAVARGPGLTDEPTTVNIRASVAKPIWPAV